MITLRDNTLSPSKTLKRAKNVKLYTYTLNGLFYMTHSIKTPVSAVQRPKS